MRVMKSLANSPISALGRLVVGFAAGLAAIYFNGWCFEELVLRQDPGAPYNIEPSAWVMAAISLMIGALVGITIGAVYRRSPIYIAGIAAIVQLVVGVLIRGSDVVVPVVQAAGILMGTLLVHRLVTICTPRVDAIVKGLGVTVVSVTTISFLVLWLGPYRSKTVATDFCNSLSVSEEIDSVLEKAKAMSMTHRQFEGNSSHEFSIPGAFGAYSACEVSFRNDRVSSKWVNNYSGAGEGLNTPL